MKRLAVAFASGVIFAIGLGISGMTHPSKVLAFLDFGGDWDPSLALVMGGGVLVNLVFFQLALRRGAPLMAASFSVPPQARLDAALVGGSALFGVGWGLGGFCPGPGDRVGRDRRGARGRLRRRHAGEHGDLRLLPRPQVARRGGRARGLRAASGSASGARA